MITLALVTHLVDPAWGLALLALGLVTLEDVVTPLTRQQIQAKIYEVLAVVGVNTTTWKPGAVVRTIIAAVSIVLASFSTLISLIVRGGFLELASGFWLTLCARYVFGVEREEATFASGEVTLVNTGGGVYELEADELILSNPDTGKTYRNTTSFTLSGGQTLKIAVVATEAGAASTAVAGAINALETPLLGVTVTNETALVGLDEESDEALKTRCREKLGSLSPNGPWDAYNFAARNARRQDGTRIGVTRTRIVKDGGGNLTLYVATASGAVPGDKDDPATDLGAVNEAIQRRATPLCVTADAISASAVTVDITYEAWIYNTTGLTDDEIKAVHNAALVELFTAQPVGGNLIDVSKGKLFVDAIRSAIHAAKYTVGSEDVRLPSIRVVVSTPSSDPEFEPNEFPALGTVTATIHQVAPPEGF